MPRDVALVFLLFIALALRVAAELARAAHNLACWVGG